MAQEKSKMEKFEDMEAIMRKVAKEEAEKVYAEKAAQYSVPTVPFHTHNNVDSPILPQTAVTGFFPLSNNPGGIIQVNRAQGTVINTPDGNKGKYVYPIPYFIADGMNGWSGGAAPVGTMVVFKSSLSGTVLLVNLAEEGDWWGIELM